MIKYFTLTMLFIPLSVSNIYSQVSSIAISGIIKDAAEDKVLPYVNVVLMNAKDSSFVSGSVSNDQGRFTIANISSSNYYLEISFVGYLTLRKEVFVGSLSDYLDLGTIELAENMQVLDEVIITAKQDEINNKLDVRTYSTQDNISQSGGSVLQSLQNLPGVSIDNGKVLLRGNEKVSALIDGKQTALTGFGSQSGLDNLPASAIERIEIINNPSSKFDANGNAGIINIILKKNKKEGFNGKVGLSGGLGALWLKKENLPSIRPQYQYTPKINPSLSLNYRKGKQNLFIQVNNLYTHTLNKNEFITRKYDNGDITKQQLKRNRNTNFFTSKAGVDWNFNEKNTLTVSGLFGSEKIIDRGDQPFFNEDLTSRRRLWQFLEDELKTTVMATASFQHKFSQPGRFLNIGLNYTFHREDEKYFFNNILQDYTGKDAFKLLSDEHVADLNVDYSKPLRYGKLETGLKLRRRNIPTNMQFFPGLNSPLDTNAGGWATYSEIIPAVYGNYLFENKKFEAEVGVRLEYVDLQYDVNPDHNTYKSDGYNYIQPFPNIRLGYKLNDQNKLSVSFNRRVDRPNEVDIRIFPKYDDAEIIKVGNPALRPQFTTALELGYKRNWRNGYLYSALYHRTGKGTITRILSSVSDDNLIYAIFQNAGKSLNSGIEIIMGQDMTKMYSMNLNINVYYNQINAFSVKNLYPVPNTFSAVQQKVYSGNIKLNNQFHFTKKLDAQISLVYLAPDIIPQGKIGSRFSLDVGIKKSVQNGKGEFFINGTDLLNTMRIKKEIIAENFNYKSADYYETQVIRIGYLYKF
ncbi:MAG: TonB-dependent receptor [Saprospiraceae bacterium]|jgi:outer membrane receptor protein involved in Fe transport|uniref:TonB-dependent receptor domain-containing protein n=1 Tax=Candidatus Brachybacter algidus TaxID=2982024 RepID=UPI001DBF6F45|nr:TonB-dependent receptor [Candidatus Brachybacter algidus]MBK6372293.1 TonB-dependent receptor [Candidatus Brachybacter algidus]MBK6447460.1 TonB-dependent receptor [Candidatus Brachybacter algidus]MBK8356701.1 TonB-dependent receptor [Candidatus Brachybacter algidus]